MKGLIRAALYLPPLLIVGCGGNEPQQPMMGADALMSSGALGTGPAKGNVAKKQPDLGVDSSLNGFRPFDDTSLWNKTVDHSAVDPSSDAIIAKMGADKPLARDFGAADKEGKPYGIPYVVVSADAPRAAITFSDAKASDAGPYPFPSSIPIEATSDAHAIVIDRDAMKLYETSGTSPDGTGFKATSGAVFDLRVDTPRKAGMVSSDVSGLPVFPGLLRTDEVVGSTGIQHALRFTAAAVASTFTAPATGSVPAAPNILSGGPIAITTSPGTAGPAAVPGTATPTTTATPAATQTNLPPMGAHLRLKAKFDITKYPPTAQTILKALKKYGMILSNQGADVTLDGAADPKWADAELDSLSKVKLSDFEVIKIEVPKPPKGSSTSAGSTGTSTSTGSSTTSTSTTSK
jgi:hypothetical protein